MGCFSPLSNFSNTPCVQKVVLEHKTMSGYRGILDYREVGFEKGV